jgi:putative membrane protein
MKIQDQENTKQHAGDHLANERTFLAWIRTSIGIMGFGFVVMKFSLFIKQISAALGSKVPLHQTGDSRIIGIFLVGLGAITIICSYLRYNSTKEQLNQGVYYHSTLFVKVLTALVFIASILLLLYLIKTT